MKLTSNGKERVTSEEINSSYQIFVIIFNIHVSLHLSPLPRETFIMRVVLGLFMLLTRFVAF